MAFTWSSLEPSRAPSNRPLGLDVPGGPKSMGRKQAQRGLTSCLAHRRLSVQLPRARSPPRPPPFWGTLTPQPLFPHLSGDVAPTRQESSSEQGLHSVPSSWVSSSSVSPVDRDQWKVSGDPRNSRDFLRSRDQPG